MPSASRASSASGARAVSSLSLVRVGSASSLSSARASRGSSASAPVATATARALPLGALGAFAASGGGVSSSSSGMGVSGGLRGSVVGAAPCSSARVPASPAAAAASAVPAPPASSSPALSSYESPDVSTLLPSLTIGLLSPSELVAATSRPAIDLEGIVEKVKPIVSEVGEGGDAALVSLARRFDRLEGESFPHGAPCVPISALPEVSLPAEVRDAFVLAYENVRAFHAAQRGADLEVETRPGVVCRRVTRAIERVGLYVPGGSAVLPSTALMLAVPAQLAGCRTVVLATPPRPDGSVSPEVLFCARLAGVTHVLRSGGAQAVAAMALGTESCPSVDKILGPGNQFVTGAKVYLSASSARVAIDMPAGPSEVLVIADATADPRLVALDLLSQAEHGPDSQAILVTLPGTDVDAIRRALVAELDALPRRDITKLALRHSRSLLAAGPEEAAAFADAYAPEHLIVNAQNPEWFADNVSNAGSVFLGPYTPESVGDYASGTNHTLPTYGYARMYSGVSLDSYVRKMTVQKLTKEGLQGIGPAVATMAAVEGLDAHRRAVTVRLGIQDY